MYQFSHDKYGQMGFLLFEMNIIWNLNNFYWNSPSLNCHVQEFNNYVEKQK